MARKSNAALNARLVPQSGNKVRQPLELIALAEKSRNVIRDVSELTVVVDKSNVQSLQNMNAVVTGAWDSTAQMAERILEANGGVGRLASLELRATARDAGVTTGSLASYIATLCGALWGSVPLRRTKDGKVGKKEYKAGERAPYSVVQKSVSGKADGMTDKQHALKHYRDAVTELLKGKTYTAKEFRPFAHQDAAAMLERFKLWLALKSDKGAGRAPGTATGTNG